MSPPAAQRDPDNILELRDVSRHFGGVVAVDHLSMTVERGTIHGLIGPNGSGKSTTFDLISGLVRANAGTILFKGRDVGRLPPHRLARLGLCRTFQSTDLFPEYTVRENLLVAARLRGKAGFWATLFASAGYRRGERRIAASIEAIAARLRLGAVIDTIVHDLPLRQQKAVALANALATGAELLMLDEPAAGLTHAEVQEVMELYRELRAEGKTILLVEHNMRTVMGLCSRITVLNQGRKIAAGSPREVADDPRVIEAYLGQDLASA